MDIKNFKAEKKFKIKDHPTDISNKITEVDAISKLKKIRKEIAQIQDKMYAHNRYSVLICLQGIDTAGKDSLIREVFAKFNVRGIDVQSFKTPTSKELEHDYLWRHIIALPEKGKFGIFNRTHYENVLVTRVHPEYILNENIPGIEKVEDIPTDFWKMRYRQIINFEEQIQQNGTIVLKFFLNLSKTEQKSRLLRRLEREDHNWKFSPGDLKERALWDKYMDYYEETIQHTTTSKSPWYIIPADNKEISRYLVAKIILDTLKKYQDIKYPELPQEVQNDLKSYKKILNDEK